ncbi:MAG TPA: hypothetical protein VEA99_10440 [Gemmatimonadaceae bacterium]|nr:hypothetical protein [Gemmatimonadaceae bacterium]
MTARPVECDERTLAVQNAGFRWAYLFLTFGVLGSVAWRAFARDEASWDLLALVVGTGVVTTGYQAAHRTLGRRWTMALLVSVMVGAVVAGAIAFALR